MKWLNRHDVVRADGAQVQYNRFCPFYLQSIAAVVEFAKVSVFLVHPQTGTRGHMVLSAPILSLSFLICKIDVIVTIPELL